MRARHPQDVLVVDVTRPVRRRLRRSKRKSALVDADGAGRRAGGRDGLVVPGRVRLATGGPGIEVLDLHEEDRRLQRVESGVQSDIVVEVLRLHAVVAETDHPFGQFLIPGGAESAVTEAAEVLAGEEAEGADVPHR